MSTSPISHLTPIHLVSIQADVRRVQTLVPAGSLLWCMAEIALHSVGRALAELDIPPASRLYQSAALTPEFVADLHQATNQAIAAAWCAIAKTEASQGGSGA